jgi:hypothetical protein
MSPSRMSTEQYQRWHVFDCVRCGRRAGKSANWEGAICRSCCERAASTYGHCSGCDEDRLLPGRQPDGTPSCRDCAGITRSFFCARCNFEGRLLGGRLCERCTLSNRMNVALDDGSGRVAPALMQLFKLVCGIDKPRSGLNWLDNPQVPELLTALASGQVPLTHEALHELPNWRTVAYLRDLLMSSGTLPVLDKQLLHFQTWLHHRLAEHAGSAHHRSLVQFSRWHQVPRLTTRARARPLTTSVRRFASEQFTHAGRFLDWLDGREHTLAHATQDDIDAWHAQARDSHKRAAHAFLAWAIEARQMPKLALPPLRATNTGQRITQNRRLALLRRILTDDQPPLRSRVAGCLMLLYAQPATRLVRLSVDDIDQDDDGQLRIRLGEPPTPVPEPFASLLLRAVNERENMHTATNPAARWLFPGRRAGQPLNVETLRTCIRELGIPAAATRVAALRQLVLQAPAPVVATALGFCYHTTHRHNTEAGGTWKTYAPGDHNK